MDSVGIPRHKQCKLIHQFLILITQLIPAGDQFFIGVPDNVVLAQNRTNHFGGRIPVPRGCIWRSFQGIIPTGTVTFLYIRKANGFT